MTIVLDGTSGITSPNETTGVLTATSINASGAITAASVTTTGATGSLNSINTFGFKNRIINGNMAIDQRNAGVAVTPTIDGTYTLDRWKTSNTQSSKFSVQQQTSVVADGFTYALKVTSLSAYSVGAGDSFGVYQVIEGFNVADFSWGTANAKAVTLSFRVYSSLTGTFGGAIVAPSFGFSYPFSYSVASANTWTTISVAIAGPTSGTFGSTNGNGFSVFFGLGSGTTYSGTAGAWVSSTALTATGAVSVVGTSGATFYITGVQLEKGSVATSFDQRAYSQELAMCQRYFYWNGGSNDASFFNVNSDNIAGAYTFKVPMRTTPTITSYNGTTSGAVDKIGVGQTASTLILKTSNMGFGLMNTTGIGGGVGGAVFNVMASAEL